MYVRELLDVAAWVDRNVQGKRIPQLYSALVSVLQANTQPQIKQPFAEKKDQLIVALTSVDMNSLTDEQIGFLWDIDIAGSVGPEAAEKLEDLLVRNALDIATAATQVSRMASAMQQGMKRVEAIKTALKDLPVAAHRLPIGQGDVLVRVRFEGAAAISDVAALKKWSNTWFDIGRGIAMAHDQSPQSIRVVGAATGSIILELLAAYAIAKTISAILLESLKVADRVMDIRRKAQEVRALELGNDKLAHDMELIADAEREKRTAAIVETVLTTVPNHDGEKANALNKSVKSLVGFIEKGGQVDFLLPAEAANDESESDDDGSLDEGVLLAAEQRRDLRETFQEIRRLEHKLNVLIEDKST